MSTLKLAFKAGADLAFYKFAKPLNEKQPVPKPFGAPSFSMKANPAPNFGADLRRPELPVATSSNPLGVSQFRANADNTQRIFADRFRAMNEQGLRIPFNSAMKPGYDSARDDAERATASSTLLSNAPDGRLLRQHGYNFDNIQQFEDSIRERVRAVPRGEARNKVIDEISNEVYGNFAVMNDDEITALNRFNEGIRHDLAGYYSMGTDPEAQARRQAYIDGNTDTPPTGPEAGMHYLGQPDTERDERMRGYLGAFGSSNPMYYSGDLQSPQDTEHRYSPNLLVTPPVASEIGGMSIYRKPRPGVLSSAGIIGEGNPDIMTLPYSFAPEPGTTDVEEGRTRFTYDGPSQSPYTMAHEMFHHKMNNLFRNSPYLRNLLDPDLKSNEFYADIYAQQAPGSHADRAREASSYLDRDHHLNEIEKLNPGSKQRHVDSDKHVSDHERANYDFVGPIVEY